MPRRHSGSLSFPSSSNLDTSDFITPLIVVSIHAAGYQGAKKTTWETTYT